MKVEIEVPDAIAEFVKTYLDQDAKEWLEESLIDNFASELDFYLAHPEDVFVPIDALLEQFKDIPKIVEVLKRARDP